MAGNAPIVGGDNAPIVCGGNGWFLFCDVVRSVLSSFAIISLRKRELVALNGNREITDTCKVISA